MIWKLSSMLEDLLKRRDYQQEVILFLFSGSAGCALDGALQIAKDLPADKRVVVVFTDSIRNYITKHLNDDWMLENGFMDQENYDKAYFSQPGKYFGEDECVSALNLTEIPVVKNSITVKELIAEFSNKNIE